MDTHTTSRRGALGALGIGASLIAGVPAVLAAKAEAATADHETLMAEFDALDRDTLRLSAGAFPEEQWDAWEAEGNRLYRIVEALPTSRENVPLKLRAIASIYCTNFEELWADDEAASGRLGRQVVGAYLLGARANG